MKNIVFASEEFPYKLHTLTVALNLDGALVFDDGQVYGDGRVVDEYLMVRAEHKNCVLRWLGQAFDGISDTCGEVADARLFCTLDRLAQSGHWKTLDEIEKWLMDRNIPFTKQRSVLK